ncbi:MAG: OOP family OmpA-OmpF porin [Halocynthiibacter sp.]|jgi:outer membrane protein OmpA-like peptidoglycan-associated protein
MKLKTAIFAGLALPALCLGAQAAVLDLPGSATREAAFSAENSSAAVAVGAFTDGAAPSVIAKGTVSRTAWKLGSSVRTTLQIIDPLRQQLVDAGYDIAFECADARCGGFDFRFEQEILPEPEMHVDLGDYRYLAALKGEGEAVEYLTLFVSRSRTAGFVQITRIGRGLVTETEVITSTKAVAPQVAEPAALSGPIGEALAFNGFAPLDDLVFETGSSSLGEGEFESLAALADWLRDNPDQTVAVVGHTDAVGSLSGNIALSRKRAASVRARLIGALNVPAGQVAADGVGYLSPRASNLSEEGRDKNRRVEVILTTTR